MSRRISKPTVSICIFTHGKYDIKSPSICLDTCKQKTKMNSRPFLSLDFSKCVSNIICLSQSAWNVIDDREPIYEIHDEDISIQQKGDKTRITYTFPKPVKVNYLENQAIYKTLTFDAKIIDIPRKFIMMFSNIFRYAGMPIISSDEEDNINSKKLLTDVKSGKTVCLIDYPSIRSMNTANIFLRHDYIKKNENLEETFDRIKCSPSIRDKLINKEYETDPDRDLNIVMVIGTHEFVLLDTTFEKNIQCMNQLIRRFTYPHQHRAIRKFYNNFIVDTMFSFKDLLTKYNLTRDVSSRNYAKNQRIFETSSKEIINLLDVLFPFGANLNWYDTSCNSISGLNLFTYNDSYVDTLTSNVREPFHKRYVSIVRDSLEIINNGLNRIHGLALGKKQTRKNKNKNKRYVS